MYPQATETYQISWAYGVNGAPASKTIEVGDTIEWVWADSMTHNVVSKAGSSEVFDSGYHNGIGYTFPHTFTSVGVNDYQCDPHSFNMFGTITVVAEGTLGINDFSIEAFSILPNPGKDLVKIEFPKSITEASIEIFDVLGTRIYYGQNTLNTLIDVSTWSNGLYLIKATSQNQIKTKRLIKN